MFGKLLGALSGKDDLEKVAGRGDIRALNAYLKTRRVLIPRRPLRFLEASSFTEEQLLELIREELEDGSDEWFEPWILEVGGKKRLPVFSSQKKMETFSKKISQQLNKVFALGSAECMVQDVTSGADIDFVDLNLFSERSWEIGVRNSAD